MAKSHYLTWTLLRSAKIPQGLYEPADLAALAEFVLRSEKVLGPVALTLDLTNPDRIQVLNRHFRGVDRTTDVIAFRDEMPSFLQELPSEVSRAGESKNWRVGESENRGAGELRKQKNLDVTPALRLPDSPIRRLLSLAISRSMWCKPKSKPKNIDIRRGASCGCF